MCFSLILPREPPVTVDSLVRMVSLVRRWALICLQKSQCKAM